MVASAVASPLLTPPSDAVSSLVPSSDETPEELGTPDEPDKPDEPDDPDEPDELSSEPSPADLLEQAGVTAAAAARMNAIRTTSAFGKIMLAQTCAAARGPHVSNASRSHANPA